MEVLGISVKGSGQSGKSAKNNAILKMMFQIKKSARSGESLNDVDNESLVDCCEWMENYRDLCEEMIRIDHQPRELITDHACLELSRCLRKRGFAPIYHCVQSEVVGKQLFYQVLDEQLKLPRMSPPEKMEQ
ncbi:hypothetical protein DAPPUDRAFT_335444 [Daphnia pulex]|uniref:Uncharacterized protein n=1 Tax=Daphnia pulex TaxID=6669 RepID=E9HXT5_DAPPU|nr:hypothetical protein DAPPUDRAFT_335444 [Daphnia pulex]|eukprot:EFX63445.1 hypothetical protein DAPPUDRAFT_335444 [Daphnia pulex]